uniref:AIG1-type G domain-containing protein n=1 Tax=Cyclopterus lumpus TaxID=8103 RepID=A0A8C2XG48_CYCLU
ANQTSCMSNSTRMVILGKTGVGKSSLANTIFGEQLFKIGHSVNSETIKCQAVTKPVNERNITLIDTPGFFDTDRSEEELKAEILRSITEFAPGPHAFLIVLKVERFTEQEQAVITKIHQYFSEEVFQYATVLFTHGDQLPEGQTIEDFVHDNVPVRDLVTKCGGRCLVVDNKYWKNNQLLTNKVLSLLRQMFSIIDGHYSLSVSNSTRMVILEKTRNNVFKWLWNKLTGNNSLTEQSDSMETHSSSDDMALSRENSTRMVILGKTGVGKSSLTNTIFGEQVVNIGHTLSSETITCQAVTKPVNERNITLIDSPGFFDTDRSEEDMKAEIVRCITEFAPGPHAFLIVLKVERFTEHEKAVITKIKKMFSEEFFQYATVLFTHGDQLPEGETIEDCIKTNVPVRDLVTKCGGRCYVVDNKYWKNNQQEEYRNNQVQVKELLKTIDQMMEANGGRCYTNEMLQAVIVLLGKTGFGKSNLANTIFGEQLFKTHQSANSVTNECQAETKSVNGRSITLIDTPGFFDTSRPEEDLKSAIVDCITECAPGPHVFLIVLKVERFTKQEQAVITKICQYFSEEVLKYAVIVFTHGEQLPEGQTIEEFCRENKDLRDLVKKCGGRCHVVDNKYWKNNQQEEYRSNQVQVEELLKTTDKLLMENNGGHYTNEMETLFITKVDEGKPCLLQSG